MAAEIKRKEFLASSGNLTEDHPIGVTTYKTTDDMSEELQKALPDIDEMRQLLLEVDGQ